jgi:mono/diheme cytochrome c family protein
MFLCRRQPCLLERFDHVPDGKRIVDAPTQETLMKSVHGKSLMVIGALMLSLPAWAQPKVDVGKLEYESHCAICHGDNGRGNGEMRKFLTKAPTDLTTMAKRNGGVFPNQLAWEMIDGRSTVEIGAHGTRAMPIWGRQYRVEAMSQTDTAFQPEWYVRNRIVALLDFLSRIQER